MSGCGQAKGSAPGAAYGSFHPHRALRAGHGLLGSALPQGDIPTVTSSLTALLATGLSGDVTPV